MNHLKPAQKTALKLSVFHINESFLCSFLSQVGSSLSIKRCPKQSNQLVLNSAHYNRKQCLCSTEELLFCRWYIDDVAKTKGFEVGNSVAEVRTKSSVGDRKVALRNFLEFKKDWSTSCFFGAGASMTLLGTKGSKWEIPWQRSAPKVVWETEKLRYATFEVLEEPADYSCNNRVIAILIIKISLVIDYKGFL